MKTLSIRKIKLLVVSDRSQEEDNTNFLVEELRRYENVDIINTKIKKEKTTVIDRILHKVGIEIDKGEINKRILQVMNGEQYNAILIMKGNRFSPLTIKKLSEKAYVVGYSGDNMCRWFNRTNNYIKGLQYYNLIYVTNIPAYREIEHFTHSRVVYFDKRASRKLHVPRADQNSKKLFDVTFIGSFEKERAETLYILAKSGIKINVWGNGWKRNNYRHPNLIIYYKDVVDEEYVKIIRESKIVLGFLRKANGDTQTSRTFEITACGTFALLERTLDHLRLYKEGEEIECFEDEKELITKVKKYLNNAQLREEIALNGYQRVIKDGYYFDVLANEIINKISDLAKENNYDQ